MDPFAVSCLHRLKEDCARGGDRLLVLVPGAGAGAGRRAPVLAVDVVGDRLLVLVLVSGAGAGAGRRRWRWQCSLHM